MTPPTDRARAIENDAVLLAAGVADLAVTGLTTALGGLRGLLRRADVAELAGEGRQELKARGRLALDRCAPVPPAHMELLARRVAARRGGATGG
ncbi:polyprenyl synthetase [Streptomyces sp. NPDC006368]|uniref:polyprenyl synthetase n=1 Tax=Streptomyces sp. NPDC006368 TaxID=3156760 RepID=UPI0033B4EB09